MDFSISSHSIRTFHRILQCLSKFGDSLSMHATNNQLVLAVLEPGHTSLINIGLNFKFFGVLRVHKMSSNNALEAVPAASCQVSLKALIDIFKLASSANNKVDRCEFSQNTAHVIGIADELRLSVSLFFPNSILQRFRLTYQHNDQDLLHIPKPTKFYSWAMSINLLTALISHFDIRLEEFTIICKPNTIQFLSHPSNPEDLLKPARSRKQLHTGLTFNTEDLHLYNVKEEVGFTLKFKEFKAALTLAKETNTNLDAAFTCGGEPIFLGLGFQDTVMAEFVLATNEINELAINAYQRDQYDSSIQSQLTQPLVQKCEVATPFQEQALSSLDHEPFHHSFHRENELFSSGHVVSEFSFAPGRNSLSQSASFSTVPLNPSSPKRAKFDYSNVLGDESFSYGGSIQPQTTLPVATSYQISGPTRENIFQTSIPDKPTLESFLYPEDQMGSSPIDVNDEFYYPGTPQ